MTTKPEMLTVAEAAAYLRVHPVSLRRMIRRGDLPALRVGRVWRIAAADLQPTTAPRAPKPEPVGFMKYVHLGARHDAADQRQEGRRAT